MLNDNAKKWVAALRSGEFEQGRNFLCRFNTHCCLGVACVIAQRNNVAVKAENFASLAGVVSFDGLTGSLPPSVRDWLGLGFSTGVYDLVNNGSLTNDNDIKKKTFAEIADVIESEPVGLFRDDR